LPGEIGVGDGPKSGPKSNDERRRLSIERPERALVSTVLLNRAERVCQQRLMRDRDNPAAHCALAQIYRKQGRLLDAAATYQRASRLNPSYSEADYMTAVLTGGPTPPINSGLQAVPFMVVEDFLPRCDREILSSRRVWNAKQRVQACVLAMMPSVLPHLPLSLHRLAGRPLGYVYFFDLPGVSSSSGDLLLFDSDLECGRFTLSRFTRIIPAENCVVLFPSGCRYWILPAADAGAPDPTGQLVIEGRTDSPVLEPLELVKR
jgi:hypothetical protein